MCSPNSADHHNGGLLFVVESDDSDPLFARFTFLQILLKVQALSSPTVQLTVCLNFSTFPPYFHHLTRRYTIFVRRRHILFLMSRWNFHMAIHLHERNSNERRHSSYGVHACAFGCVNGACVVLPPICQEFDAGNNPNTASFAQLFSEAEGAYGKKQDTSKVWSVVDMVRKSLNQLEQMIMDWYEILKEIPQQTL